METRRMVLGNLAVGPDCPFLFQWMCMTISAAGRLCGRKEVWQQGAVQCWKERQSLIWWKLRCLGKSLESDRKLPRHWKDHGKRLP